MKDNYSRRDAELLIHHNKVRTFVRSRVHVEVSLMISVHSPGCYKKQSKGKHQSVVLFENAIFYAYLIQITLHICVRALLCTYGRPDRFDAKNSLDRWSLQLLPSLQWNSKSI